MKTIEKYFKRLRDAERFQSMLYGKFDSVKLVSFPRFSQEEKYTWHVA